jgi:TRAP-type C4-dicarboxylate transport system substrate-binding protein
MAPEQLFCERPFDRAVDVWALGVILYECLAGVRPLPGRHIGQVVRHLENEGIVPLEERDPTIPRDVARLVARMLRFDRRERLDDLAQASQVLERYVEGAPSAPVDGVDAVAVGRAPPSRPARALSYLAAAVAAFLLIPSLSAPPSERGSEARTVSALRAPPAPAPPKEPFEPKRARELVVETTAPKQSGWARMLRLWSKAVAKRTLGRLTIDIQHGGAHPFHGGEASMLSRMRTGQTAGAALSVLTLAKIHPGVMALQVPGILDEWDELDRARAAVRDELDAVFRDEGYVIAAWGDVGRVHIMSRGYKVRRPEDLRQRRAVMMEADPLAPTVYSLMRGAVPVPLGSPDVLPALRRGAHGAGITAVAAPALLAEEMQWAAWLDNVTLLPAVCATGATVLRERALEPLPSDTRAIALELARRIEPQANAALRKLDDDAFLRLLKRVDGVKLSREETRAWHRLFESASEKFAQGIIPDELLDKVRRAARRPSADRLVSK